jgi:peptidyl-prolyl cis-trans isomerase C
MKKLLYVMLFVFMLSCSETPQPINQQESKFPSKANTTTLLAKVNAATISLEDVKKEFAMLPPEIQQLYMTADGMESLLDELIKKELLYQEAVKRGYDKQPKFTQQMEEFSKRLLIEYLLREEVEKKAVVSDKAIKDFYASNKESFVREVPGEDKKETIEFEKVEDLIRNQLVAEQQRTVFDGYVKELKGKANIEIDDASIKAALGNSATP